MTSYHTQTNEALARQWQERVRTRTFSQAVQGVGTIRIMGKAGDAPLAFPRITSLEALSSLAPDEQWALRAAQVLVEQAPSQQRSVFAVGEGGANQPERVTSFEPMAESLIVVSRVAGG